MVDLPIGRHPTDRKKMAVNYKNGRHAVTRYKVLKKLKNNFCLIECQLETGRTHQIRAHLASEGHPLAGDMKYGQKEFNRYFHEKFHLNHQLLHAYRLQGQTLHAGVLGFIHPSTKEYMEFSSELPEYFQKLLKQLEL